jgi:hypothetical protein
LRRLLAFAALLSCLACAPGALADERILSYDSVISVRGDSTLEVHETVRVRAEGVQIRQGIFRDFPKKQYSDGRGAWIEPRYQFLGVRRDGATEASYTEARTGSLRLYTGTRDQELPPGEYTYEIAYRTTNLMGLGLEQDELYWNVTGTYWDFAIDKATARVILPQDIPRNQLRLRGYTGSQGSSGSRYIDEVVDGVPTFTTTRPLAPHEAFTIRVTWPKGFIQPGKDLARISAAPEPGFIVEPSGSGDGHLIPARFRFPFYALIGLAVLIAGIMVRRALSGAR